MPKAVRAVPPPLELLCLNALWSLEKGNVKEVQQFVARTRPLAYTTIMTVLERLVRKGLLARKKVGRAFVYIPQTARDTMRRTALRELLEGFFDGSQQELARFLSGLELGTVVTVVSSVPASAIAGEAASVAGEAPIDTVLL